MNEPNKQDEQPGPSAALGTGYAASVPDAAPTVKAVLAAAKPGSPGSRLTVIGGPPGVGKSTIAAAAVELLAGSMWIDKDSVAGGFILRSATDRTDAAPYGSEHYWRYLRPLEYAGPTALACANLVGRRHVFLVGGWGPELADTDLWPRLAARLAPARLDVVHLDAPPPEIWRRRLAQRGSRCDSPYFEELARQTTALAVWSGARRLTTNTTATIVVQRLLEALDHGIHPESPT
jgi:predicted kinase